MHKHINLRERCFNAIKSKFCFPIFSLEKMVRLIDFTLRTKHFNIYKYKYIHIFNI